MSNDEKLLTVKDAMYRTAKDLEGGALWTSQAIASIAELAGIDKRYTHSQALIALSSKLDEENELAYEQGLRVGAGITALKAACILAKGHGWPEPDDEDQGFGSWIDRCFVPAPVLMAFRFRWATSSLRTATMTFITAKATHTARGAASTSSTTFSFGSTSRDAHDLPPTTSVQIASPSTPLIPFGTLRLMRKARLMT